jgi:hypothetical protein
MLQDGNKPMIGASAKTLGVRVEGDKPDVSVDEAGNVKPATGGMSVAPTLRDLPYYRVPKRLKHIVPGATGSNLFACWRMGDGNFADGEISEGLQLRVDRAEHGMVEPSSTMSLRDYQGRLHGTQDQWVRDEA